MAGKLYLWEKVYLYYKGWIDARTNAFRDLNSGKVILNNCKNDMYQEYESKQDKEKIEELILAVSPFLETESQRYVCIRNHMLAYKLFRFVYYDDNKRKRKKIESVVNAISGIDKQIEMFTSCINITKEKAKTELEEFSTELEEFRRRNLPHKVKLYEEKMQSRETTTANEIKICKEILVVLKSERERIIRQIQLQMYSVRSKRYLRIKYYYEVANKFNCNIPIFSLSEDNLNEIIIFGSKLDFEILNEKFSEYLN